jgi:3',5'-cyclic AMP phosphodiesterase CpdA
VDLISCPLAIQRLALYDVLVALRELCRVLKPGGVLRLGLVDFDTAIDAYRNNQCEYLWCRAWNSDSGNFITQIINHGETRTPLTREFAAELLEKAGFGNVRPLPYRQTTSRYPEIVDLDSRPDECCFLEAAKPTVQADHRRGQAEAPGHIHLSWTQEPHTSLTVHWQAPSESDHAAVEYREQGHEGWKRASAEKVPCLGMRVLYQLTLTNLKPNTHYEYRVLAGNGTDAARSEVFRTRTAPHPGPADFRFAFLCDTGLIGRRDGNSSGTRQVIDDIIADCPLFVLGGGDYAYANGDRRFNDVADAVDAWFVQMEPMIAYFPLLAQYGNHEVLLGERWRDWAPRFAHPEGFDNGKNYSFDVANVHLTALFVPGPTLRAAQLAWLDADLARARDRGMQWLIVFQHEPIFAHGHSHPSGPEVRQFLTPILERHGVDLHLSGHDQNYERTYPLTDAWHHPQSMSDSLDRYEAGQGVIYAKVSPGGKMSDVRNDFSRFSEQKPPFIAARDDTSHHYALVNVQAAGEVAVEIYGVVGDGTPKSLVDSFRIVQANRANEHLSALGISDR